MHAVFNQDTSTNTRMEGYTNTDNTDNTDTDTYTWLEVHIDIDTRRFKLIPMICLSFRLSGKRILPT